MMFEDKPSDMSVQITPADQEALGLKKPASQKSFSQNRHLEEVSNGNNENNNTARDNNNDAIASAKDTPGKASKGKTQSQA